VKNNQKGKYMKLRYSEYFKIPKEVFDELGVFNGFISYDSRYYLNPKLLKDTNNVFFKNSYDQLRGKFSNIIKLIDKASKANEHDPYFEAAIQAIISHETGYIGLGYSSAGTNGRGIGRVLATSIAQTCFILIKQEKIEPELFELLGVFKKNISVDRISDMIVKVIKDDILNYTQHIATKLNLDAIKHENYSIPYNKHDRDNPLYFIPTSLLSKLPIWDEIFYEAINESNGIIEFLNAEFGKEYAEYLNDKKYREKIIIERRSFLNDLIKLYKKNTDTPYDFIRDSSNDFKWVDNIIDLVKQNPIKINKELDLYSIVEMICNKFQSLVENTNAYKLFYDDKNHKKNEKTSQQAFQLFAHSYCDANNLDISPESNGGQGPVDFKFSQGNKKILVELKLSTTSITILKHCLDTQIEIYKKSENTDKAILLILMVGSDAVGAEKKVEKLIEYKNTLKENRKYLSEIVVVDATIKKSASKA
jgi:hypothetical protein